MTLVAEVRRLDDEFEIEHLARLLVPADGPIDVLELKPDGAAIAAGLLGEALVDPYGRTVTLDSGADFIRTVRWALSNDRLWVTPLVELPDGEARDPAVELAFESASPLLGTVPYPEPPPELARLRIVELRRPDPADFIRETVQARLVEDPPATVRVEAPDPVAVREVDGWLAAAGRPSFDDLGRIALPPGTYALPLEFDQPGDRPWRDALVGTRRSAVDPAVLARLDLEYATLLPRVWLSRCPFTGQVLRMAFDGWAFDGPYWDPAMPLRPAGDVPATFLGLAGAVSDRAAAAGRVPPEALGSGRPPVFAGLLAEPAVRAVLSAVQVGRWRCDVVAYFVRGGPAGAAPFREWGTRLARLHDDSAEQWVPRPEEDPPIATDLDPLLRSGQLLWTEEFDSGVHLRSGPADCPWADVP
jgi:hypothetical protein